VLPLRHLVESGFFAARELTVQLVWGPGPYGALPELVAQRAPFALVDVPTAARAAEQKVELLGVFHLYAADPAIVFTLERAVIHGAEQLAGRRIGVSSPHLAGAFALRAALREAGLEAGQVELVSAAGDLPTLLESGRVAAVAGSRHLAPGLEQRGLRTVYLPRAGWEAVPGPLIAASRAFAAERPDVVKRFVGALRSGIQGTLVDPSALRAAAERILANGPAERGAVRAQVESLLASLSPADEGQGPGWVDPGRVVAVERYLRELGVTKGTAELSKVLVNDFLIGGTSPR
jgi:NitT/TauT family transport system substrate-binding protein